MEVTAYCVGCGLPFEREEPGVVRYDRVRCGQSAQYMRICVMSALGFRSEDGGNGRSEVHHVGHQGHQVDSGPVAGSDCSILVVALGGSVWAPAAEDDWLEGMMQAVLVEQANEGPFWGTFAPYAAQLATEASMSSLLDSCPRN